MKRIFMFLSIITLLLLTTVACDTPTEPLSPINFSYVKLDVNANNFFGDLSNGEKVQIQYNGTIVENNETYLIFNYKYGTIKQKLSTDRLTIGKLIEFDYANNYTVYIDYAYYIDGTIGLQIIKVCQIS